MSRIGRMPVPVPDKVDVEIKGQQVRVKGPLGELERTFNPEMTITQEEGVLKVTRPSDEPKVRALARPDPRSC